LKYVEDSIAVCFIVKGDDCKANCLKLDFEDLSVTFFFYS